MNRFIWGVNTINEWVGKSCAWLVLLVTLIVTVEVVMRYGFSNATRYGYDLTIYASGMLYALAGVWASRLNAHVRIDIVYLMLKPRYEALADLITAPFFYIGIIWLMYISWPWAIDAIARGLTFGPPSYIIVWPMYMALPVAASLIFLQGVVRFHHDFHRFRTGQEVEEAKLLEL